MGNVQYFLSVFTCLLAVSFGTSQENCTLNKNKIFLLENAECRTPDNKEGECVPVERCVVIKNQFYSIINEESQICELQNNFCGLKLQYEDQENTIISKTAMVCCPELKRAKDLQHHKNYRKLNEYDCGIPNKDLSLKTPSVKDPQYNMWTVRIGYNSPYGHRYGCGGSLITNRHVLTAAHCITNLPHGMRLASVLVGDYDVSSQRDKILDYVFLPKTMMFNISSSATHPDFDTQLMYNNIGIITLHIPTEIMELLRVSTICLPLPHFQNKVFYEMEKKENKIEKIPTYVVGWGTTEHGTVHKKKQVINTIIVAQHKCKKIYDGKDTLEDGSEDEFAEAPNYSVHTSQICAASRSYRACDGDSGGALYMYADQYLSLDTDEAFQIQKAVVLGVTSCGPARCGTPVRPGIYTRVHHYLEWILDNLDGDVGDYDEYEEEPEKGN